MDGQKDGRTKPSLQGFSESIKGMLERQADEQTNKLMKGRTNEQVMDGQTAH